VSKKVSDFERQAERQARVGGQNMASSTFKTGILV